MPRLSATLEALPTYPFVRLAEARAALEARGVEVVDLGVGEPREETPAFLRRAVAEAVEAEPVSGYPASAGLEALREAAAGWVARRFGARVDPATEVVPTYGSKEAIFLLAQVVEGAVAVPVPGYPVYDRGARFAGRDVVEALLDPAGGWLPDLDALPWGRLGLLWVTTPGNPTAATASLAWLEEAAARCRAHDVVLASDEAYCELWFDGAAPPASALQLSDRTGVLAFHTLSKRSSMPGYRSGFVAGDPVLVAALKRFRPNAGTAPQTFVQRASVAAWSDDAHVAEIRARYGRKREVVLPALLDAGFAPAGGDASFFLWLRAPGGDDVRVAEELLQEGVVVAPGSWLGRGGEGHVRVALVPTVQACAVAAERLSRWRAGRR